MRIQLLQPPVYLNPAALTALRPAPPLGLAYVAAALRATGREASKMDTFLHETARRVLRSLRPRRRAMPAALDPSSRLPG